MMIVSCTASSAGTTEQKFAGWAGGVDDHGRVTSSAVPVGEKAVMDAVMDNG